MCLVRKLLFVFTQTFICLIIPELSILKPLVLSAFLIGLLSANVLFGQGCSDAGVCSAGGIGSAGEDSIRHSFSLGRTIEMGERFSLITTTLFEAKVALSHKIFIQARIPYFLVAGDLGSNAGISDLLTSINIRLWKHEHSELLLTVGGKIATGRADEVDELQQPLPMPYQPSSGTDDLLIGVSMNKGNWHFAAGYQHPMNRNENAFLHSRFLSDQDAIDYFQSNKLKRGDDLIARVERMFAKGHKAYTIGLLPIWRVQHDEIIDEDNKSVKLNGSDQLTINLNLGYAHDLDEHVRVRLSFANPIWWRRTRADGLTRFFVFYGGVTYSL